MKKWENDEKHNKSPHTNKYFLNMTRWKLHEKSDNKRTKRGQTYQPCDSCLRADAKSGDISKAIKFVVKEHVTQVVHVCLWALHKIKSH